MEYIYAALLLHKLEQPVSEENMKKVIGATGAQVDESKIKTLLTSLQGVDIGKELENASIATVAAPAGSAGGDAGKGEAKKEEKKEEEKPSESAAGLASLFG